MAGGPAISGSVTWVVFTSWTCQSRSDLRLHCGHQGFKMHASGGGLTGLWQPGISACSAGLGSNNATADHVACATSREGWPLGQFLTQGSARNRRWTAPWKPAPATGPRVPLPHSQPALAENGTGFAFRCTLCLLSGTWKSGRPRLCIQRQHVPRPRKRATLAERVRSPMQGDSS